MLAVADQGAAGGGLGVGAGPDADGASGCDEVDALLDAALGAAGPPAITVKSAKSPWKPGSSEVSVPAARKGVTSTGPEVRARTAAGSAVPHQLPEASARAPVLATPTAAPERSLPWAARTLSSAAPSPTWMATVCR